MNATKKIIIGRFESHKIDTTKKLMLFCGIGIIIISVIKFMMATSNYLTGIGWWFDTLILFALPGYFLIKKQRQLASKSGQFIEWINDSIIFKLKNEVSPKTILREQVEIINIHLNTIEIIDKTAQKFILDISDFDNYKDRLKIKENFEREKIAPNNGYTK